MAITSHLKSFQALALALRTGSLKAAAEELAITPAAVGQRIKVLEDYLGMELLVRGRSGLRPADELAPALPHIEAAFRELDQAAGLLNLQRGHEIHIAGPGDFVELWLKPRLPGFLRLAPRARFCINGEGDAPYRLARADCTIRFAPREERPDSDALFADYLLPICSPGNLERFAGIAAVDRLEGTPLLHLDAYKDDPSAPDWPQWVATHGLSRTAPERGLRFQRIVSGLDAVRASAGLMICGLALILDLVEDETLALPYPVSTGAWTSHAYQARFLPLSGRPDLQRFRQWLVAEGRGTAGRLARFAG
ncbi:MAG: transcriptional regulator, LysR family [Caulobacter sp.]|nr:transcriptional regulator, LysR family [Caulobacter sp.]